MTAVIRSLISLRFLLSLSVSIALWVWLTIVQNPEREDTYPTDIPIEVSGLRASLVVVNEVGPIRVRIAAPEESWRRLQASSFRATVNLTDAPAGLHQRDVVVECSDPDVRFEGSQPAKVSVRVEETRTVEVPVRVTLLGAVPFGFRVVGAPIVEPERIMVQGPESLVAKVSEASVSVQMEELRSTAERSIKPEPRGAVGTIAGVRMDPQAVRVTIQVEQIAGSKTVPVVASVRGQPSTGYWLSGVATDPPTVQIVGNPSLLETLASLSTQDVDVQGAQSDVVRTVQVVRPAGVSLLRDVGVSVRVAVGALPGQQVRETPVLAQSVAVGLLAVVNPPVVTVAIVGSQPVLQRVGAGDLSAVIDMSGFGPGTYVVTPTLSSPDGVRLQRISPELVTVTITVAGVDLSAQ